MIVLRKASKARQELTVWEGRLQSARLGSGAGGEVGLWEKLVVPCCLRLNDGGLLVCGGGMLVKSGLATSSEPRRPPSCGILGQFSSSGGSGSACVRSGMERPFFIFDRPCFCMEDTLSDLTHLPSSLKFHLLLRRLLSLKVSGFSRLQSLVA